VAGGGDKGGRRQCCQDERGPGTRLVGRGLVGSHFKAFFSLPPLKLLALRQLSCLIVRYHCSQLVIIMKSDSGYLLVDDFVVANW
jgi:hypothetical protein